MQEVRDSSDYEHSSWTRASEAIGLLEDSRGVVWLINNGRPVGSIYGQKKELEFGSITWHPTVALCLLQGMSVPQATGLVLEAGVHRPVWHPRPGVDGVRFTAPLDTYPQH